MSPARPWLLAVVALIAVAVAGCGVGHGAGNGRVSTSAAGADPGRRSGIPAALLRQARPVGRGARFHPASTGPVPGRCERGLGARMEAHLEVFAANRVVLVAAGIGTRAPRRETGGTVTAARCYGSVVTLDPTGVLRFRPGAGLTVAAVFAAWGQSLSADRLLSFHGKVFAYVDGRRWRRTPAAQIPLTRHAEIVLEVGPHVPPHPGYRFAAGR